MASKHLLKPGPAWSLATNQFRCDVQSAVEVLAGVETTWEGRDSVLRLKEADFHWRQMEWWAFYFEFLCRKLTEVGYQFPGDRYCNTTFDTKRQLNWDLKAKAIKTDSQSAILNDQDAMRASVKDFGEHGVLVALCDVEYNDEDRSFQKWHDELKGKPSQYVLRRRSEGAASRYRKTRADLAQILFYRFHGGNIEELGTFCQGRNSNDTPRPPKFMLNLEEHEMHIAATLDFVQEHR